MSSATDTPPQTECSGSAWFEIGGLRGRTVGAWVRNIGFAAFPSLLGFAVGINATGLVVAATLFAIGGCVIFVRWSRGRISLYEDRMRIERWTPHENKVVTIPYSEIRHLCLDRSAFGIVRERGVHVSGWTEITLHPVIAEDLLDRLTEHMEQLGHRFTVDERGSVRSSWTWTLLELFPWQELTTTASLQVTPSGGLEYRTDRMAALRGSCFKAWEIHAPGDDPAESEPVLRLEEDRVVLQSGMLIGKVAPQPGGVMLLVFSGGSVVELQNGEVSVDEQVVGRIVRGGDRFVLELDRALPEVVALLALSVHARAGRGGHSLYRSEESGSATSQSPRHRSREIAAVEPLRDAETLFRSRELAAAGPQPHAEPLLLIEAERPDDTIRRLFKFWHRVLHHLIRFFKREWRHSGWGSIAFQRDSIHVVRDPVRELGEREIQQFDLAYGDVNRLEFIGPDTLILAFGLVIRGLNQQIAMVLGPLDAHDKFDSMVALLEDRGDGNLFSMLDEGRLTHSREWTWEERFEDLGLADEVTAECVRLFPARQWVLQTGDEEIFEVIEDHGLVLVRADEPTRALMQVFHSQILDGAGFALSLVERDRGDIGFRTSRDERLILTKSGDIRMGETIIGEYPPAGFDNSDGKPDHMHLYGSVPTVPAPSPELTFHVDHPIPKPWLLTLVMISLLRREGAPENGRVADLRCG